MVIEKAIKTADYIRIPLKIHAFFGEKAELYRFGMNFFTIIAKNEIVSLTDYHSYAINIIQIKILVLLGI